MRGDLAKSDSRVARGVVRAFWICWICQICGLVVFNFGTDAAGQAVQVSPLNSLMIGVPLYTAWLCVIGGVWIAVWMVVPVGRRVVSAGAILFSAILILLTEVDFGMQLFRGERISLLHFKAYLTPSVVNGDWLGPVLQDRAFIVPAVAIWFLGWAALVAVARGERRSVASGEGGWRLVAKCAAGAAVFYFPVSFAWYHQRDMVQPPEVLLARAVVFPVRPFARTEEIAERDALRARLDPSRTSRWISDEYPLMRDAALRGRATGEGEVQGRATGEGAAKGDGGEIERPDIIFFVVESLRGRDVGYGMYPRAPGASLTPHLDSLAAHSVVFPRYIANGEPSPRGFITINTGSWEHEWGFIIANFPNLNVDAIPARLRAHGYHTMAFWGGNPSFDNQLTWARRWYDERVFGLPEDKLFYLKTTPDRVVMDRLIDHVNAHDHDAPGQPFFAYVASNGTHTPYEPEERAAGAHGGPEGHTETRQQRYDLCLENIDAQIGRVIEVLKKRPRWKNTVIVVIGDHSDRTDEIIDERWRGMPADPFVWTAALVYGPERVVGAPRREEITASHVDLMPSVLAWVGDRGAYAGMGRDMFATIPDSERSAVSVNSRGYRLDRGGFTLLVDSRDPAVNYAFKSFPQGAPVIVPLAQTPFAPNEPEQLSRELHYWSGLIEQDRVWRDPATLGAGHASAERRP